MPVIISNCSNNYGPYQYPEKLIPKLIYNILNNIPLPIYGDGKNSREWIHVSDHCKALFKIFKNGKIGHNYNIGSNQNFNNITIAKTLLKISKNKIPIGSKVKLKYIKDRPGHDFRYAIDASKIEAELNWKPQESFETGIKKTILWYLKNQDWWRNINRNKYQQQRLGLKE